MDRTTKFLPSPTRAHDAAASAPVITTLLLLLATSPVFAQVIGFKPPDPALGVDTHLIERATPTSDYQFNLPFVPPMTQSVDHRIGLIRKLTGDDNNQARFFVLVPEKLTDEIMVGPPGAEILSPLFFDIDSSLLHDDPMVETDPTKAGISHFALCESREIGATNPRPCNDGQECYDLEVITPILLEPSYPTTSGLREVQLWRRSITVEVAMPKTASAKIDNIVLKTGLQSAPPITGDPQGSTGITTFHTPMIVGDNRLLIVRFGQSDLLWTDAQSNPKAGRYDPVYSYYPDGDPCDITRWTDFKPLAYAPHDITAGSDDVTDRFGFAKQPYLTPTNTPVPVDFNIRGRYLWVDQEAKNVFYATLGRQLIGDTPAQHLYALACPAGTACADPDDTEADRPDSAPSVPPHMAWMMMGQWTHGKMVLLDSYVNHTDFALQGPDEHHRDVHLFQGDPVRIGTGRYVGRFFPDPLGWPRTTVQFGSLEHFFNMKPYARPRTPRDVVWLISAGARSDEIAFDDYISHRTLIFSPMNAVKEMVSPYTYFDGLDPDDRLLLQNAATSRVWTIPAHGEVVEPAAAPASLARIEHVALGGIKARGFYLSPEVGIRYDISSNDLSGHEWMLGIFVDRREMPGNPGNLVSPLITFPNGSYIGNHGVTKIRLCGSTCMSISLPKALASGVWSHLAFRLDTIGQVSLYQDGFLFATVNAPAGFGLTGTGNLTVGSPDGGTTRGFGGWIDEFKLIEGPFNPEEICNHARGTLVGVPASYKNLQGTGLPLADLLDPFENTSVGREAIHEALYGLSVLPALDSDYYVCNIDYTSPAGVSVNDPGDPLAEPLRQRLLFPEGPLLWSEPRPDSAQNNFCTACHRSGDPGGLDLAALDLDTTTHAREDTRRQPMQTPKTMAGLLPIGYLAAEKPPAAEQNSSMDPWLLDGPILHWGFDDAFGSTVVNSGTGEVGVSKNHGTVSGAQWTPGDGRGHALYFNGDDWVAVAGAPEITNPDRNELTLAGWIKVGAAASTHCRNYVSGVVPCTLIGKSKSDVYWSLRVYEHQTVDKWQAQLKVRTNNGGVETTHILAANLESFDPEAWNHLIGMYDEGWLRLYFNGTQVGQKSVGNLPLAADPPGVDIPVMLGARPDANGLPIHYFYGQLDGVRVYNRALTTDEILALSTPAP